MGKNIFEIFSQNYAKSLKLSKMWYWITNCSYFPHTQKLLLKQVIWFFLYFEYKVHLNITNCKLHEKAAEKSDIQ